MARVPEVPDERLAAVRARHDAHVVVVGEADARIERQAPLLRARRHDRVAQALGGAGHRGARRQAQRLLDLGRRLRGQAQEGEGQARVEARELLDVRIARAPGAERGQRAPVVLGAVAQEADVVAEAVELGVRLEDRLEDGPRPVVLLPGEVREAELEADRRVRGRLRPRLLEERHGELGPALRRVHDPRVVERLDVVGRDLEGALQVGERRVVPPLVDGDDGLGDVDIGLGRLGSRARTRRERQHQRRKEEDGEAPRWHRGPRSPNVSKDARGRNGDLTPGLSARGSRRARPRASAGRLATGAAPSPASGARCAGSRPGAAG